MTEREKILGRIREALVSPAPGPAMHDTGREPGLDAVPAAGSRQWLPKVGDTFAERLELFRKNTAELKARFELVDSPQALADRLVALRDTEAWKKVGVHQGELTGPAVEVLGLPVCRTDTDYNVADLESCDVGITECDALVAQTGSVLITSRSAGGRALSVLPPHHVVLARREQLIADLPEAFSLLKRKYAPDYPSFLSFITGPSRTGDIERILVLGAHGPKKLTILCV
ncbi:MAG TPA: LUD domain-containing protein [Verrucomicrobiae bacterium]|nr:LUD domain-containing protein [Verrucomicrobiae bacterium]